LLGVAGRLGQLRRDVGFDRRRRLGLDDLAFQRTEPGVGEFVDRNEFDRNGLDLRRVQRFGTLQRQHSNGQHQSMERNRGYQG